MDNVLQSFFQEGQTQFNISAFPMGNSIIALAGENFALAVIDERSRGVMTTHARNQYKLFSLSDKSVLGSTVCWCEKDRSHDLIAAHVDYYEENSPRPMTTAEIAYIIAKYSPRFFPNHKSNVFIGVDENGKGSVYMYDTENNFCRGQYHAAGLEGDYLSNILMNEIINSNVIPFNGVVLTKEYAIAIATECFRKIQDRGDQLLFQIITAQGIETRYVSLEFDSKSNGIRT